MKDDLIWRRELLEHLHRKVRSGGDVNIDKEILEFPAVDAVEVVRCKDCRMAAMLRKPKGEAIADCMLRKFHTDDEDFIEVCGDDFCSYGVRREDDA